MAFLDNSGDIILDAVLTDAGRQRMARGDFKIVKFALGDEEINYEIYNSDHPSGSAFFDLSIMQTPVLEAFTNNTSLMKTKLLSLNRNNVLFMPKLAMNTQTLTGDNFVSINRSKVASFDGYFLLADDNTIRNGVAGATAAFQSVPGVIAGTDASDGDGNIILIDQGIDGAGELPLDTTFPPDLIETAFMVKVDHRLLRLEGCKDINVNGGLTSNFDTLNHSFVDDDGIATYYIASSDPGYVDGVNRYVGLSDDDITQGSNNEAFVGPLGNRLAFAPRTSNAIKHSDGLFNEIGNTNSSLVSTALHTEAIGNHKYIDTIINVVGVTTGYSLDIPIRIIKKS